MGAQYKRGGGRVRAIQALTFVLPGIFSYLLCAFCNYKSQIQFKTIICSFASQAIGGVSARVFLCRILSRAIQGEYIIYKLCICRFKINISKQTNRRNRLFCFIYSFWHHFKLWPDSDHSNITSIFLALFTFFTLGFISAYG